MSKEKTLRRKASAIVDEDVRWWESHPEDAQKTFGNLRHQIEQYFTIETTLHPVTQKGWEKFVRRYANDPWTKDEQGNHAPIDLNLDHSDMARHVEAAYLNHPGFHDLCLHYLGEENTQIFYSAHYNTATIPPDKNIPAPMREASEGQHARLKKSVDANLFHVDIAEEPKPSFLDRIKNGKKPRVVPYATPEAFREAIEPFKPKGHYKGFVDGGWGEDGWQDKKPDRPR